MIYVIDNRERAGESYENIDKKHTDSDGKGSGISSQGNIDLYRE